MQAIQSALSGLTDEMVTNVNDLRGTLKMRKKVQAEQNGNITAKPKRVKEGSVCVYFGRERLARAKARAKRTCNGNLSQWVCNLVDSGLEVSPEILKKVNALASLRGIAPGKLIERLIEDAVRV